MGVAAEDVQAAEPQATLLLMQQFLLARAHLLQVSYFCELVSLQSVLYVLCLMSLSICNVKSASFLSYSVSLTLTLVSRNPMHFAGLVGLVWCVAQWIRTYSARAASNGVVKRGNNSA